MKIKYLIFLFILTVIFSCSSGTEIFIEWSNSNEGKVLSEEKLNYLINEFGYPLDTIYKGDEKIFAFRGIESFHSPKFSRDETKKYISDYKKKTKPVWDRYYSNQDNEEFRKKFDLVEEEFKEIYYSRVGVDQKYSFNELVNDFQTKNPTLSLDQSTDSIVKIYNIDDFDKTQLTSTAFNFRVEENIWYSKYYNKDEDEEDFLIDIFQEVRIDRNKIIISDYNDSSFCLSEKGKNELEDLVIGDWVYDVGSGRPLGAFKFSNDGTYSMSNTMASKKGKWWITCGGQIGMTNSDKNIQLLNNGIKVGSTVYKKL